MIAESTDSERALLSAMVVSPDTIDTVSSIVSGTDFDDAHLGHFYDVVVTAHEAGRPIGDIKVLVPELRRAGVNVSVTNAAYLGRLFSEGQVSSAAHYAGEIARCAVLRRQHNLAQDLLALSSCPDADPEQIRLWLDSQLASTVDTLADQCRTVGEIAVDYIEELRQPQYRDKIIMSGLPSLDETVGGWMPGELVVLAARTSMGKTALGMQMACHAASRGKSVLFASLEMKDRELVGRILCGAANVNARRVRSGNHDADDISRIEWAAAKIHDHNLRVWSATKPTVGRIRANGKRVKAAAGLDLLIVDYIGLVAPNDRRRDRYEQVGQITGDLKAIAKELDVPVLALCQLNREADKGAPMLSHLRESGSIEQDADCVLFVHRADLQATDATIIVAKHRHGETGRLAVRWVPGRTQFEDTPTCEEWTG